MLGGYSRPVLVTHAPGGGRVIFIVEQTGKIKRATYANGRWKKLGTFLDLSSKVNDPRKSGNAERGLLGLAFHPRYQRTAASTSTTPVPDPGGKDGDTVVAEYRRQVAGQGRSRVGASGHGREPAPAQPQRRTPRVRAATSFCTSAWATVVAGATLKATARSWARAWASCCASTRSTLTAAGPAVPHAELQPAGRQAGLNDLWAWGLRNPWRFSFDRGNGNLWIGDVGQGTREEVDRSRSNARGTRRGQGPELRLEPLRGHAPLSGHQPALQLRDAPGPRLRTRQRSLLGHRWLRASRSELGGLARPIRRR